MGLNITKKEGLDSQEVFQKVLEILPGGFTLDSAVLTEGDYLDEGAIVEYNEATRKANLVKTAKLYADAANDATTYQVEKNHHFKVTENLAQVVGGKAYAITAIDKSNENYDVLTVGTTLGVALTAADGIVLFQSSATGATAAVYSHIANGLVRNGGKIETNTSYGVVVRGTVYANRMPYAVSTAMKTALGARFIFSASF